MAKDVEQVFEAGPEVFDDERGQVAEPMLESRDAAKQVEMRDAWKDEILRRMAQMRAGDVELETWGKVRRAGREAVAQR